MKRLYLLRSTRHRSTSSSTLADYHHPLTQRGEITAIATGKKMQANGYIPASVLCSSVTRARQTLANLWPFLIDAAGKAPLLTHDYHIHLARHNALLQKLQAIDAAIPSLLVVSIAPGICDLARLLIKPKANTPNPFNEDLPMGALAIFDCDIESWAEIAAECGTLVKIIR